VPSRDEKSICVIGLGNVLMGDDAFGPYVIQVLESRYRFPQQVAVRDLGTPSLDLISYIREFDVLIVLDTVSSDGEPGELRFYDREAILKQPLEPRISPHEPALKEALLITEFDGSGPSTVTLIGVIPYSTETGIGLSPAVARSVDDAVFAVANELQRLGVSLSDRASPSPPSIWWEESAVTQ